MIQPSYRVDSTGKPIIVLDASSFAYSNCLRRIYYTNILGLRENSSSSIIKEFGTAVHRFIRAFHEGASFDDAVVSAATYFAPFYPEDSEDFRNVPYLVKVCKAYKEQFPFFGIEPLELEATFSLPIAETPHATYILCGTIDMIARHPAFGAIILDHKTTSVWKKGDYLSAYQFSVQLLIYSFVLFKLRGVQHAAVINGIFMSKTNLPELELSRLVEFTSDHYAELEQQLLELIHGVDNYLHTGNLPPRNFRSCEGKWGLCPYSQLCVTPTPDETVISLGYKQKTYDPLKFQND